VKSDFTFKKNVLYIVWPPNYGSRS
jgi:hypothetical protein